MNYTHQPLDLEHPKTFSEKTQWLKLYGHLDEQRDLVDKVNANIAKISIVLLALAVLLTVVSFSLINNTVKLGIYARRFSIHTMKLVGASWGFIRRPFLRQAVLIGLLASILACAALGGCFYALYYYEPEIVSVLTFGRARHNRRGGGFYRV